MASPTVPWYDASGDNSASGRIVASNMAADVALRSGDVYRGQIRASDWGSAHFTSLHNHMPSSGAQLGFYMTTPPLIVKYGQPYTCQIYLESSGEDLENGMNAMAFQIDYNIIMLGYVGFESASEQFPFYVNSSVPGRLTAAATTTEGLACAFNYRLLQLHFQVQGAPGSTASTIQNALLTSAVDFVTQEKKTTSRYTHPATAEPALQLRMASGEWTIGGVTAHIIS